MNFPPLTQGHPARPAAAFAWLLLLLALPPTRALAATTPSPSAEPHIVAIEVSNEGLLIAAETPPGVVRLVLEDSERGELRAWRPRAVQRVTAPGTVTFRLPFPWVNSLHAEMFRVRADTNDPLPAAFYTGRTSFAGDPNPAGSPVLYRGQDGAEWVVPNALPGAPTSSTDTAEPARREVAESDIWQIRGNRLYFFNQQRGLQVLDISNPDAPRLLATHPLPASGEQLYLLGDHHLVLLARSHPCDNAWGQDAQSAAIVLDVGTDSPRETARVPLEGRFLESRLVGQALYVATDTWTPRIDGNPDGAWVNGTRITGIDLANKTQPKANPPLWFQGSGNVVSATERYLMVGVQAAESRRWWESDLHLVDIQDPTGVLAPFTTLRLSGRLQDKFKLAISDDVLTVITAGPGNTDGSGPWRTTLTNYRLLPSSDPSVKPAAPRLGSVEVGHGEQLYATRFDGKRAYLVTFLQIDPLWIVDLSDPADPRVLGELEIPGWSTYIHPMGDRLLTVGFDNTRGLRTAVQLFDVSNPATPTLLAKAPLGREWSWSEANTDEKALGVFPQAGLVLVPFSSSTANQPIQGVQVFDLERDTLTARGRIESPNVVPRRTTLAGDRVLAISARDLVTVSLTDRDRPEVRNRLELAYPVDRVLPIGPWLVELSESHLRTRRADASTEIQARLDLEPLPVLGTALKDNLVLILQARPAETVWQNDRWITNQPPAVLLTVLDANALPRLSVLGSTVQPVESSLFGDFEALWPTPDLAVWCPQPGSNGWYPWMLRLEGGFLDDTLLPVPGIAAPNPTPSTDLVLAEPAPTAVPSESQAAAVWDVGIPRIWPGWNPSPSTLLAFDLSNSSQPHLVSQLPTPEGSFSPSRAHSFQGLIYFSHDTQSSRIIGTNTYVSTIMEPVVTNRVVVTTNLVHVPYEGLVTNVSFKEFSVPAWELSSPLLVSPQAGTLHVLAASPSGIAFGWGDNRSGQLGSLTLINTQSPVPLPLPGPATSLAAAKWFSLARLTDGSVWMAGTPLGPEGPPLPSDPTSTTGSDRFRQVTPLPSDVTDLAAGYHHAFARTQGGALFAWGRNDRGQLGLGDTLDQLSPTAVPLPAPITTLTAGGLHSLALTANGQVLGWGDNQRHQLGAQAPNPAPNPFPIQGLPAIRDLAAGDYHSLALDQNQTVWTWGEGSANTADADTTPRPVLGLPPVRQIAAGRHHSVAIDLEGRVWSWGSHVHEPFRVNPLEPIQSVSARGSYAIANGVSGRTYLWQLDDYPTPAAGTKTALKLTSLSRTNIEPGVLFRLETEVVTKTIRETRWVERSVTNAYPVVEYLTHHHLSVVDYSTDPARPTVRNPVAIPGALQGIARAGALLYTLSTRPDPDPKAPTRTWLEAAAYDGTAGHLIASLQVADLSRNEHALTQVTPNGTLWLAQFDGKASQTLSVLDLNETGAFQTLAKAPLDSPAQELGHLGETLSVSLGGAVQRFNFQPPATLTPRGTPFDLGCLLPSLHRLADDTTTGTWAPLGDYGVAPLP